jgi:hypothetical protein
MRKQQHPYIWANNVFKPYVIFFVRKERSLLFAQISKNLFADRSLTLQPGQLVLVVGGANITLLVRPL